MEELRQASKVYYNACSRKERKAAEKIFKSMDANGDGQISVSEFNNFLSKVGIKRLDPQLFGKLDMDGNGYLDFDESLFLYYILYTRPWCDECGTLILGMYYSCVKCYLKLSEDRRGNTFDLCPSCLSLGGFNHKHSEFLDNYALLRRKISKGTLENMADGFLERFAKGMVEELIKGAAAGACSNM